MSLIEAIILGIVQGLTEFLPVSSSAHLIITERIMGIELDSLAFELVMHLGTLCAVVFCYRKSLLSLVAAPLSKPVRLLIVATIPTVVIVFAFNWVFRSAFSGQYLVQCFLITAILLLLADRRPKLAKNAASSYLPAKKQRELGYLDDKKQRRVGNLPAKKQRELGYLDDKKQRRVGNLSAKKQRELGYLDATIIGLTQGFAAFPGISRSGSTISVSMLLGIDKKTSADFSFILSIPIIVGSAIVELVGTKSIGFVSFLPLFAGFMSAFISGLIAIKLLMRVLKNVGFDGFAIYLFCLSLFLLLNDNLLFLF